MHAWHKEAEKQWDERAEWWHQSSEEMWGRGSRKTIVPFVTTYMPKEGYIADIGCGDGYGSYKLCEQGYRVIGLDLSSEMIELARKRRSHEHLHFQQACYNKRNMFGLFNHLACLLSSCIRNIIHTYK